MKKKKKVKKKIVKKSAKGGSVSRGEKPVQKKKIVKKAKKKSVQPAKKFLPAGKQESASVGKKKSDKQAVQPLASTAVTNAVSKSLEEIGVVTHYFPHVEAAVIKVAKGGLSVGDTIVIKGHTTDLKEKVDSIQLDHAPITSASIGQEIGLKVQAKVREHDVVYKLIA